MAAITYEFMIRKGAGATVVATVTNDAGKVTWKGKKVTVESIQRMIADDGIDLSDPKQMPKLRDRYGRGSYFSAAPADR